MEPRMKNHCFLLGILVGVAGFLSIAYLLTQRSDILWMIDGWGADFHRFVSSNEWFIKCVTWVTSIGNRDTYIVLCVLLAILGLFVKRKKWIVFILCTFILTVIGNSVIKDIFERERPDLVHLVYASGFSFPSGHAMNSTVFFGLMAYFLSQMVRKNGQKAIIIGGFTLLILLIAISRVAVGVHYISDVSAGIFAGLAILSFSLWIYEKTEKREKG